MDWDGSGIRGTIREITTPAPHHSFSQARCGAWCLTNTTVSMYWMKAVNKVQIWIDANSDGTAAIQLGRTTCSPPINHVVAAFKPSNTRQLTARRPGTVEVDNHVIVYNEQLQRTYYISVTRHTITLITEHKPLSSICLYIFNPTSVILSVIYKKYTTNPYSTE